MYLLQFFERNAVAIQAILMAVLVGCTIVYAIKTGQIAGATKKSAEATLRLSELTDNMMIASIRPLVILKDRVTRVDSHDVHHLALVNIGLGPALDVSYNIKPKSDHTKAPTSDVIEILRHENKGHALGIAPDNFKNIRNMTIEIAWIDYTIEYEDFHGNIYKTTYKDGRTVTDQVSSRSLSLFVEETA